MDKGPENRWLVLAVLASSLLVVALDATILNVALPTLAADLKPSSTELLWIVDAYGLVLAGLLVAMSGLGDRIGRRRLLVIGLAVFAAAAALADLFGESAHLRLPAVVEVDRVEAEEQAVAHRAEQLVLVAHVAVHGHRVGL